MDHSHAGPANIAQTMDYNEVDEYLNFTSRQAQFFIGPKLQPRSIGSLFTRHRICHMFYTREILQIFRWFSDGIFILLMQSVFKTIVIVLHLSSCYVRWSCYETSSLFRSLLLLSLALPCSLRGRCCCCCCYCCCCCCCRRLAPPSEVIVEPSGRIATCDIGGWSFFVFRTDSNDEENRNVRTFKACSE